MGGCYMRPPVFASACVCFFRDRAALELLFRLFRVQVESRATHTVSYRAAYGRGQAYPSPKQAA